MSFIRNILVELREKKLWPIPVVLIIALVAVPILLSNSGGGTVTSPLPPFTPPNGLATSTVAQVPDVATTTTPTVGEVKGRNRNPFLQASGTKTNTATTATTSTTSTTATTPTTGTTSTPGSGTSPGSSSGSTPSTTTTTSSPTTPTTTPTITIPPIPTPPPPAGLEPDEAYEISLATTTGAGGVDTVNNLTRLSVLPSLAKPMLIELGVLKGGHRVLFEVQTGSVLTGPGTCIPGVIDCQLLSLAEGDTEELSQATASGAVQPIDLFSVTTINKAKLRSVAAAMRMRRTTSAQGRALLDKAAPTALSLFPYKAKLGVILDTRDLGVGAS